MAFATLEELREELDETLGIDPADSAEWGTVERRYSAIRKGFAKLYPTMQRLLEETISRADDTVSYDLTSRIREVQLIEAFDASGNRRPDLVAFRAWHVDADAPVTRIRFQAPLNTATETLVVTGYAPYLSDMAADTDACDIAPDLQWIPLLGALAELYRRRFHTWLDFERYNASNPTTAISPDVLYQAYQDAERQFETAKIDNGRKVELPKAARVRR